MTADLIHSFAFYLFAFISAASAIIVVSGKNLFRSVLALGIFFLTVGGLYFHLNAQLLAASQILLYVGGVIVLILFGIMFTPNIAESSEKQSSRNKFAALITALLFGSLLLFILFTTSFSLNRKLIFASPIDIATFAKLIFGDFLLVIELLGLIFLSAIIGAAILSRQEEGKD